MYLHGSSGFVGGGGFGVVLPPKSWAGATEHIIATATTASVTANLPTHLLFFMRSSLPFLFGDSERHFT
jgi:hypothetical protein